MSEYLVEVDLHSFSFAGIPSSSYIFILHMNMCISLGSRKNVLAFYWNHIKFIN